MTITYIYHSCYLIEFDEFSILIDYYKDADRPDGTRWVEDYLLNKEEELYVLCTHSHSDHYNPDILSWRNWKKNIKYIFSEEILESEELKETSVYFLNKEQVFEDHRVKIKAFGSTDAGGSFLINCGGKLIFHAGDLNNWHWREEVDAEEALSYENHFLCELELISEKSDNLYIAMFPVDPRLGKDYMRGPEQFIARIKTDYFMPMHFGDKYDMANQFEETAKKYDCKYLPLTQKGQSYHL